MAEVLPAPSPHDEPTYSLHGSSSSRSLSFDYQGYHLSRSPSPSSASREDPDEYTVSQSSSSSPASPSFSPQSSRNFHIKPRSFHPTPPSSTSLDVQFSDKDEEEEEELAFPSYDDNPTPKPVNSAPQTQPDEDDEPMAPIGSTTDSQSEPTTDSDPGTYLPAVSDDTAVRNEPSRQVNYLSHDWKEEDIWASWKHISSRRKVYGERSRLENASWRTWAKQKYRLKTVSPETLNWLKDCDVTWLYGPLQEGKRTTSSSEPASRLSKSNSFLNKKPILKKRSVSEEMLHKSLSSSSLLKQAAAAVQAQRSPSGGAQAPISRPRLRRSASDFSGPHIPSMPLNTTNISTSTVPSSTSSGTQSPEPGGRRHIRFDNNVEQCIAVDFKDLSMEEEAYPEWLRACPSSDSEEDDLPIMKTKSRKHLNTPSSSRNSFSQEGSSKGIAKLPSTTLKYHQDDPDCIGHDPSSFLSSWRSGGLSPSASQETLRPTTSRKSANFLLDEEDEDAGMAWEPAGAFGNFDKNGSPGTSAGGSAFTTPETEDQGASDGMRRTPSGMFMPFDEDDDNNNAVEPDGIVGRVVNTVNTAKDICYVLYNVGWRK